MGGGSLKHKQIICNEKNNKEIYYIKNEDFRQGDFYTNNFKEYLLNNDYENYIVEYSGDIIEAIKKLDYAAASKLGQLFAIVIVKKGMLENLLKDVKEIIYTSKSYPYTLSDLNKVEGKNNYKFLEEENQSLNGEGVIVGIIGTGIDYLNERFTDENNKTRIIAIWDQSLEEGPAPSPLVAGTEFVREKIDEAIKAREEGKDPYSIVSHKEAIGYGTEVAGIIGGRKLYPEDPFISVAPKCEFAIVKLRLAKETTLELNGVEKTDVDVYESVYVRTAILYLTNLQKKLNKPMVVYLPLGTNLEGHDGLSPIERYIDYFAETKGIVFVANTGNQGDSETHTSGNIFNTGGIGDIEVNLGEKQKNFYISIWFNRPDRVSIGITSPKGVSTGKVTFTSTSMEKKEVNIEESKATIEYFISYTNGVEFVNILIRDVYSGIWKINLFGDYVIDGKYDAWLFQRELLQPDTRYISPDPFITLTVPSTSLNSITTSYYDTNSQMPVPRSGKGFTRDGRIKPDVCTGGTNIMTTTTGGGDVLVSGAAAGGAILAGAVALITEWGLVKGNDKNLYVPKVKTYLIRSTERKPNEKYPNETCGYGMFSFNELFKNLEKIRASVGLYSIEKEYLVTHESKLFVRIPCDLC